MTVFDDRPCELGEGPFWHPERQQFFWFDIMAKQLLSRAEDGPLTWDMGEHASAAGWIDRDTLLIASETGLSRFDILTGDRTRIAALETDTPNTRSNDGRADPMGGFWIGTMGKKAEPKAGAIYRYYAGKIRRLFGDISIPNAICFAPDGRRAYFADTPTQKIWTVALDAEGWPEDAPDVFVDLSAQGLFPDGAVTDAEGAVWNAQWGAGRVARYHAAGSFDRAITLPAAQTTCPCFGGPDFETLFVTSAWEGLVDRAAQDGQTFALTPGVQGRAEPRVKI